MQLKDLETVESRIIKVQKQAQSGGDKTAKTILEILFKYKEVLLQGKSARTLVLDKEERKLTKDFCLLTDKPILYVCNVDEASAVNGNHYVDELKASLKDENAEILIGMQRKLIQKNLKSRPNAKKSAQRTGVSINCHKSVGLQTYDGIFEFVLDI